MRAVISMIVGVGLAFSFSTMASAQEPPVYPTTTPEPLTPTPLRTYEFRIIVSGPATVTAGSIVTYRVTYEQVDRARPGQAQFAFVFPAEFDVVSTSLPPGAPECIEQPTNSLRCIGAEEPSGVFYIDLRIDPTFTGEARVGTHVFGTGIVMPPGSVSGVSTQVLPASATTPVRPNAPVGLPGTGMNTSAGSSAHLTTALVLGALLVASGLALGLTRRQ